MGKDWDKAVPGVDIWKQCVRVLKPGAFAFILCTPRQDCLSHMIVTLESAGFNVGFSSLYHVYASGFPKAENISLAVDKRECRRQLAEKLGRDPTKEEFDEAWKTFREVVHKRKPVKRMISGAVQDRTGSWIKDDGRIFTPQDTSPRSAEAKILEGSYGGFQLKPSVEVILVAMKPLSERTFVDQALKNRKGITWLDDCRIPFQNPEDASTAFDNSTAHRAKDDWKTSKDTIYEGGHGVLKGQFQSEGRFPANLLTSEDALNDGAEHASGHLEGKYQSLRDDGTIYGISKNKTFRSYNANAGSFSRYFDLDKWFEKQLAELPEAVRKVFPFLICAKASKSERNEGCETLYWEKDDSRFGFHQVDQERWNWLRQEETRIFSEKGRRITLQAKGNIHTTVKPLKLMSFLITLGSRPNDVVLDPFIGSGTTAIAARILQRHFIGIELGSEYVKVANERVRPYLEQQTLTETADRGQASS